MINSAEEFIQLRTSDNPEDYGRAIHEEASNEIWLALINNYPDMRVWVALNKTIPLEILDILSGDSDSEVRFTVALKRKLSFNLFEKLAADSDESVRLCIVRNKKVPKVILELLSTDPEKMVSKEAQRKLNEVN